MSTVLVDETEGTVTSWKALFLQNPASFLFTYSATMPDLAEPNGSYTAPLITVVSGFKLRRQCTNGTHIIYNCSTEDRLCQRCMVVLT